MSNSEQPNITIIGATAFLCASKLLGSHNFELCLCSLDIQANSVKLAEAPDLSNVPSEYHNPVGPIYSLSASEQEALKEFIEENLNMGFIWPTSSLHGAPVLFIKKKDGSLRLCIDFHGLNCITKKVVP